MALSFERYKAEIMDEFSKEEMFQYIMYLAPVSHLQENREYYQMQSARRQLLMHRSKSKFPERT